MLSLLLKSLEVILKLSSTFSLDEPLVDLQVINMRCRKAQHL